MSDFKVGDSIVVTDYQKTSLNGNKGTIIATHDTEASRFLVGLDNAGGTYWLYADEIKHDSTPEPVSFTFTKDDLPEVEIQETMQEYNGKRHWVEESVVTLRNDAVLKGTRSKNPAVLRKMADFLLEDAKAHLALHVETSKLLAATEAKIVTDPKAKIVAALENMTDEIAEKIAKVLEGG